MNKQEELTNLVLEYQKTKSSLILNKIIYLNTKLINWYLNNTNLNISKKDLYSLIITKLEYSILRYEKDKYDNISRYIYLEIRNAIYKESIYIEDSMNRLFKSFLDYKEIIEKKYGTKLEKDFSIFDDIIDLMIENNIIRESNKESQKKDLIELLKDYYGSLKIKMAPVSNEIMNSNIEIPIDSDYLKRVIKITLTNLEYKYLGTYYGLFGNNAYTLEELASFNHVSKENISQIKNRALEKLKTIFNFYNQKQTWNIDISKLNKVLISILTKEELLYLTSFYGIFNNSKKSYYELKTIYHIDDRKLSYIVDRAITKIFFYIEYQDITMPYTELELKNVLVKILTKNEYNVFTSIYGLFQKEGLTKEEYLETHNISRDRLSTILLNANNKLKSFFIKNYKLLDFLKSILTSEEYEIFSLRYGLFKEKISAKQIALKYNMDSRRVNQIIKIATEKIKIMFKYIDIKIDKNKVQEILQSLLTKEEYIYLAQTYGIFGYKKLDRDSIYKNKHKLARTNIKTFTKVATILNIENKG